MPTRSRQPPDRSVRRADAVVVHGCRVYQGGSVWRGPIRRLERSVRLLQEGEASLLVLSGGGSGLLSEVEILRRAALARGIPEVALLSESGSRTLSVY